MLHAGNLIIQSCIYNFINHLSSDMQISCSAERFRRILFVRDRIRVILSLYEIYESHN